MEPTMNRNRIQVIDSLRGFALFGLPFVNVLALWSAYINLSGTTSDLWIQRFLYIFVEGRFYAIFSFLFGLGLWIFYTRAQEKENRPLVLFIRRMLILFGVGVVHQLIHPGEALLFYSMIGIPVFFLHKMPKLANLLIGIIGIIVGSLVGQKILLILPLMILGLAFGQYRLFETFEKHRKKWLAVMVISLIIMSLAVVILWQKAPANGLVTYKAHVALTDEQIQSNLVFYDFAELSLRLAPMFSVFYVSLLVLLSSLTKKMGRPLQAFGRMAFTNYIGQSIILVGFTMFIPEGTTISYLTTMLVCLVLVVVQMGLSMYWFNYFKYGPLEWLWRCGTYQSWLAIRKG